MTITDLKHYSERMNARMLPTDKRRVVLNRAAVSYIGAFLNNRKASLEQSLSDPKISAKKRDKREFELVMINETINALQKSELI